MHTSLKLRFAQITSWAASCLPNSVVGLGTWVNRLSDDLLPIIILGFLELRLESWLLARRRSLKSDNLQYIIYAGLLGRWEKQLDDQAFDVPSNCFHNFL